MRDEYSISAVLKAHINESLGQARPDLMGVPGAQLAIREAAIDRLVGGSLLRMGFMWLFMCRW